ncbi:MAG: hypothetical protein ACTSQY_00720 [Candidatus Odinarchaeia archaeon]
MRLYDKYIIEFKDEYCRKEFDMLNLGKRTFFDYEYRSDFEKRIANLNGKVSFYAHSLPLSIIDLPKDCAKELYKIDYIYHVDFDTGVNLPMPLKK